MGVALGIAKTPHDHCYLDYQGLKSAPTEKKVQHFFHKYGVDVFVCLETQVKKHKSKNILLKMVQRWNHSCNYPMGSNERIWLLWKRHVKQQVLRVQEQFVHYYVKNSTGSFSTFLDIIYARNEVHKWLLLWQELVLQGRTVQGPCFLSGNFNNVLSTNEKLSSLVEPAEVRAFQECVDDLQLTFLSGKNWHYTFCNKKVVSIGVYSKTDS